jgi:hypothetical protein
VVDPNAVVGDVKCFDDELRVHVESPTDGSMIFVAGDYHLAVADASSTDAACVAAG